ncbi:hypothetical protein CS379_07895 [Methylobacterium frigidaeris]|nr:hypothetical protein CS379_07895 [Methylobacterium frigidaeris]
MTGGPQAGGPQALSDGQIFAQEADDLVVMHRWTTGVPFVVRCCSALGTLLPLFDAHDREKSGALMAAMDACNSRFGRGAVVPARRRTSSGGRTLLFTRPRPAVGTKPDARLRSRRGRRMRRSTRPSGTVATA